jgi:bacterial/archaeal transporter family protein
VLWVLSAVGCVVCFGLWAFFGKLALRHGHWVHVNLAYGLTTAILFAALYALPGRRSLTNAGVWPLIGSAVFGSLGLLAFYVALDRQKASIVVPMIAIYPVVTAVLAFAFLGERLTVLQGVGIALAVGGAVLIGIAR